jgi:hypothetical protein
MRLGNYFYQVEFNNGKMIRRNFVPKKIAEAAGEVFAYEMAMLEVRSVEWGKMN